MVGAFFGDRSAEKEHVLRTLKPFSQLLGDLREFFYYAA
jgi:hypothetical protein